jgi:hypothetical protein
MSDNIRRLLVQHIVDRARADGAPTMAGVPHITVTVDQLISLARADARLTARKTGRRRRRRRGSSGADT